MCTLSFIPKHDGYIMAMNRDELISRPTAAPPSLHQANSVSLIYPQEPSGGTWIAVNSHGDLLALMNANAPTGGVLPAKSASRGGLIPALLREQSALHMDQTIGSLGLVGMHPFRLFAVFPQTQEIVQWTWDGTRLSSRPQEWIRNHWFSSSRSDSRAESERGRACEMSWHQDTPDTLAWLRSLHSSHIPDAGAFSICVHREDAATVSYTEVNCGQREVRMSYLAGHPCTFTGSLSTIAVPRSR
jgi:Transport and Golgi organisation 2